MKLTYLLATLVSVPVLAESYTGGNNFNPFANTIGQNPPVSVPSDSKFFNSTDSIVDNSLGNSRNGLEYKAADANRQANAGMAAAIAAGSALSAAGTGHLLAGNLPEAARLFGLAGMEFAQAGASAGAGAENMVNRGVLLQDAGQNSRQSQYDPAVIAQRLMTPEAVSALNAQGVDPNGFFNSLTSGTIRNGSDALSALGGNAGNLNADQVTQLNNPTGEDVKGILDGVALGVNESADPNATGGFASSFAGSGLGNLGNMNTQSLDQRAASGLAGLGRDSLTGLKPIGTGAGGSDDAVAKNGASTGMPDGLLESLGLGAAEGAAVGMPTRLQLLEVGIIKAKGQTIFKVASRQYHGFQKWRALRAPKAKKTIPARGIASIP